MAYCKKKASFPSLKLHRTRMYCQFDSYVSDILIEALKYPIPKVGSDIVTQKPSVDGRIRELLTDFSGQ